MKYNIKKIIISSLFIIIVQSVNLNAKRVPTRQSERDEVIQSGCCGTCKEKRSCCSCNSNKGKKMKRRDN